jgi:hypothetical protein
MATAELLDAVRALTLENPETGVGHVSALPLFVQVDELPLWAA